MNSVLSKKRLGTDHLSLVLIFRKPLHSVPQYLPGRDIPVPNTSSRKPLLDTFPKLSEKADIQVNMVMSNVPVSDRKMLEIRHQTAKEAQLVTLKQTILSGWPNRKSQCPSTLTDFCFYRD